MSQKNALLVALNALQAIDEEHPYPIAKHAIVQISKALAQPEPWDESDMAYRPNGLSVEPDPVAKREWVSLTDEEAIELVAYQHPLMNRTAFVRSVEAALRSKNNG